MTSCNKNGECLIQCRCKCFNKKECVCGHRDHNGYCPSSCCVPVECRNFPQCNTRVPKWLAFLKNGTCINCDMQMGRRTITSQVEDCCVCFENKIMLSLKCNHKICNECWYNVAIEGGGNKSLCPLCRNKNDWSK